MTDLEHFSDWAGETVERCYRDRAGLKEAVSAGRAAKLLPQIEAMEADLRKLSGDPEKAKLIQEKARAIAVNRSVLNAIVSLYREDANYHKYRKTLREVLGDELFSKLPSEPEKLKSAFAAYQNIEREYVALNGNINDRYRSDYRRKTEVYWQELITAYEQLNQQAIDVIVDTDLSHEKFTQAFDLVSQHNRHAFNAGVSEGVNRLIDRSKILFPSKKADGKVCHAISQADLALISAEIDLNLSDEQIAARIKRYLRYLQLDAKKLNTFLGKYQDLNSRDGFTAFGDIFLDGFNKMQAKVEKLVCDKAKQVTDFTNFENTFLLKYIVGDKLQRKLINEIIPNGLCDQATAQRIETMRKIFEQYDFGVIDKMRKITAEFRSPEFAEAVLSGKIKPEAVQKQVAELDRLKGEFIKNTMQALGEIENKMGIADLRKEFYNEVVKKLLIDAAVVTVGTGLATYLTYRGVKKLIKVAIKNGLKLGARGAVSAGAYLLRLLRIIKTLPLMIVSPEILRELLDQGDRREA